MNRLKIGVSLSSLDLPLRRGLAAAQRMEVAGVELAAAGELSANNLSQTGRRELLHLLRSHNLELAGLLCPLRHPLSIAENQERRIDFVREAMTLSCDLGLRRTIVHPGKIPADDDVAPMAQLTEALAALAQHGDRIGAVLALESGLDDGTRLDAYLSRFDTGSLAVSFSPVNLFMNGHDPYESATALRDRMVHAHAGDARSLATARGAQEVPLGHGDLDWMQLLGILEQIGYHNWLVVERTGSKEPVAEIADGVQVLRRLGV